MNIFEALCLLALSIWIKMVASLKKIPSNDIDTHVRLSALSSIRIFGLPRTFQIFINPISAIRYIEFDFVRKHSDFSKAKLVLDVSSPRVFGFYIAKSFPKLIYEMINPDPNDIRETGIQKEGYHLQNFTLKKENALFLPERSNSFDIVISISVIEHIPEDGDTKALKEMWRVLKPGGRLILTTHVIKKYRTEYRDKNQYGIANKKYGKKYFFQRMYDKTSLQKRIIDSIGRKPEVIKIFGEKTNGWFDNYIRRWIMNGIKETVYDPWYAITQFKNYNSIHELPGVGIIGLVFEKPLVVK